MGKPNSTDAQSMITKGTEYELLVQQVFNMLHNAEGVEQIKIQHDVTMTGLSGANHQLDLYWEFKIAGVFYRVAVECKNYASAVSKEKISAFKGVLNDLGGISGIYVCKSGYQKGALQYADAYGIQLLEIRRPTDKDWEGRMRDIHIRMHYRTKCNFKVSFAVDKEWAGKNCKVKPSKFRAFACDTEIEIAGNEADAVGFTKKSVLDFIRELPSDTVGQGFKKIYTYNDAFVVYRESVESHEKNVCSTCRFKIKAFKIVYDVNEYVDNVDIYGDRIVMAIVKNIQEQTERTVAWDGRVWDREECRR